MDKKTTVFLAKKLFTELVFNTAYIEGVNVTFPQTQTILDGGIVNQVPVSDIQTVLNLRDAWRYCINNFESTTNYDYLCKINEMVSRNESLAWGSLRTGKVGISGTEYMPEIPKEDEVKEELNKILAISDTVEKSIGKLLLYRISSALLGWEQKNSNNICQQNSYGSRHRDSEHWKV